MSYPSLLYLVREESSPIDISVFEDLQLLNFFSEEQIKPALVPCRDDNITARQKLFESLSRAENREKLEYLSKSAQNLCIYADLHNSSRIDEEKYLAFASFAIEYVDFAKAAADFDLGDVLTKRFSEYFKKYILSEDYSAVCEKIKALPFEKVTSFDLKLHGTEIKTGNENAVTYISSLMKCAYFLGIDDITVTETKPRRISPDILLSNVNRNSKEFSVFAEFYGSFSNIIDMAIVSYSGQISFCLAMLDFLDIIAKSDIPLVYPSVSENRQISVKEAYDVSLLAKGTKNIIPNDIDFSDSTPFYYLTGANGGGKTTYLRTVGITAVMYLLGCPVPAESAEIGGVTGVCTHFPRDERFDGSGRFVEENRRVQEILGKIDRGTLVLLNETYSTTNEENAVAMTEKLANTLWDKKTLGLYITHQHSLSESEIPYLNVMIDKEDANRRTYKIVRQKATGGSFAEDILLRYGLTEEALERRFGKLTPKGKDEVEIQSSSKE